MTAAHCSDAQATELTIRVAGSTFNVVSVTKHPRYSRNGKLTNDIALIKLERAVQFDDNIKPICVYSASNPQLKRLVESAQRLKLAYWKDGSDELKTGIVNRLHKQACTEAFNHPLGPDTICVMEREMDWCIGGCPLSIKTNVSGGHQRFVQVRIPSYGNSLYPTTPTVYTDVLYFSAWIASVVRN